MTFHDNHANWDKHFDDLMDRALKRIIIILLLLIARKLTFEYDQMRVTSRYLKTINKML